MSPTEILARYLEGWGHVARGQYRTWRSGEWTIVAGPYEPADGFPCGLRLSQRDEIVWRGDDPYALLRVMERHAYLRGAA